MGTVNDDLAVVVRLACLTADRTDREQKALLSVADRLDVEHNKLTVGNDEAHDRPGWQPSRLYDEAQATREVEYENGQKPVELRKRRGVWPRKGA